MPAICAPPLGNEASHKDEPAGNLSVPRADKFKALVDPEEVVDDKDEMLDVS